MLKWIFIGLWAYGLAIATYIVLKLGPTFNAAIERAIRDFFIFIEVSIGIGVVVALAFVGVWTYTRIHKRHEDANRQRDGSFQLRRERMNDGTILEWDPTRTATAGTAYHPDGGFRELPSVVGEQSLVQMFEKHMGRAAWQAAFAGDGVFADAAYPVKEPSITAGAAKMLTGSGKPKTFDVTEPPAIEEVYRPAFPVAIGDDTNTQMTIGYFDDGRLAHWEPDIHPHLRFHGRTRSGKSNAIVSLAASARNAGAHVVVNDLRFFRNWSAFGDSIEKVNSNDIEAFASALDALHAEYQRRDEIIGRYNVPDFTSLPDPFDRIVFVITEFGATWKRADAAHPAFDVVEVQLIEILTMAGAAGINVIFEDQIPGSGVWPREVASNSIPVAGTNDRNAAALVGHNAPHTLEAYTFSIENGPAFRTWDMTEPANVQYLNNLPAVNGYRLMNGVSHRPSTVSPGVSHEADGRQPMRHDETPWNGPSTSGGRRHETTHETKAGGGTLRGTEVPTYLSHGDAYKEAVVLWYMDNFGGKQTACVKWIDDKGYDISRSYVYKIYAGRRSQAARQASGEPPVEPADDDGPIIVDTPTGEAEFYDLNTEEGRRQAADLTELLSGKKIKAASPGNG